MTQIKTPSKTFDLDRTVHEDNQEWRKHLVMVSTDPNRLVGLVASESDIDADRPRLQPPFVLYGALLYVVDIQFQPLVRVTADGKPVMDPKTEQPHIIGVRGNTVVQALIAYDLLAPVDIVIHSLSNLLWIGNQHTSIQEFFYKDYLRVFDPPKVIQGSSPGVLAGGR